jgi:hypothetical protein
VRSVWKFPFTSHLPLEAAIGARPVVVLVDNDPAGDGRLPCIWIESTPPVVAVVRFEFCGTGHPAPIGTHVGSVVVPAGFVWHVYKTVVPL